MRGIIRIYAVVLIVVRRFGGRYAVVAGERVVEQYVVFLRAQSDIVDDERTIAGKSLFVGNDADMPHAGTQRPGDDIAGQVFFIVDRITAPLEIPLKVGNPAMVDVGIRPAQSPTRLIRIAPEMFFHVLMYLPLQVDALMTQGADHDVCADSPDERHVAQGIGEFDVCGIVDEGLADLRARVAYEPLWRKGKRWRSRERQNQQKSVTEIQVVLL